MLVLPPQVMYSHELAHGGFLLVPEVKAAVLQQLRALLRASDRAVEGLAHELTSLVPRRTTWPGTGGSLNLAAAGGGGDGGGGGRKVLRTLTSLTEGVGQQGWKLMQTMTSVKER